MRHDALSDAVSRIGNVIRGSFLIPTPKADT